MHRSAKKLYENPLNPFVGSKSTDAIQRTTTAVTIINGGFKENVLASSAKVLLALKPVSLSLSLSVSVSVSFSGSFSI